MTERRADRQAGVPAPRQAGGSRLSSLLRDPLPVIAATAASFLVVLALLTARVVRGSDPALRASASSAVLASHRGHAVLRTTASGRVIGAAAQGTGAEGGAHAPAAHAQSTIVTRTSGGFTGGGEQDG